MVLSEVEAFVNVLLRVVHAFVTSLVTANHMKTPMNMVKRIKKMKVLSKGSSGEFVVFMA